MSKEKISKISAYTGVSIVVANMIGTGAFTSLGFQLESITNTASIITLWILGGILALCGAFSYAEVGTFFKKSGGEYTFLSEIYHPIIGYLSGWISLTVGFAAPIALSALAFTEYFPIKTEYPHVICIALIAIITFIHSRNLNSSSTFQNITTFFKVFLILVIIVLGVIIPSEPNNAINFEGSYWNEISSATFAVSFIYVTYSYSGWNAAAYITEEFKNPSKSLPIALVGGTLIVTILYTLLQITFLKHVPLSELTGKLNIGTITSEYMLGAGFAKVFSAGISLLLISGISAMVWVGPRVTSSISERHHLWRFFKNNSKGIPVKALWLQFTISAILIITGTFNQIMIYCGILLTFSSLLVIVGVFILRYQNRGKAIEGYKSPFFPYVQIIFAIVAIWMIVFAFINNTHESLAGLLNVVVGLITYFLNKKAPSVK